MSSPIFAIVNTETNSFVMDSHKNKPIGITFTNIPPVYFDDPFLIVSSIYGEDPYFDFNFAKFAVWSHKILLSHIYTNTITLEPRFAGYIIKFINRLLSSEDEILSLTVIKSRKDCYNLIDKLEELLGRKQTSLINYNPLCCIVAFTDAQEMTATSMLGYPIVSFLECVSRAGNSTGFSLEDRYVQKKA